MRRRARTGTAGDRPRPAPATRFRGPPSWPWPAGDRLRLDRQPGGEGGSALAPRGEYEGTPPRRRRVDDEGPAQLAGALTHGAEPEAPPAFTTESNAVVDHFDAQP